MRIIVGQKCLNIEWYSETLLFPLFDSNEYCIATNLHHNVNKFKCSTSTKEQNTGKNKKKKWAIKTSRREKK